MSNASHHNFFVKHSIPLLIAVAFVVLGSGCGGPATMWSTEVKSPDGRWLAFARGQQWSGPGNDYEATSVYLQWAKRRPTEILEFSDQYATTVNVKMEWISPSHLNVVYAPSSGSTDDVSIDFQAIKCAGVDITIQGVSSAAFGALQGK